MTDPVYPVNLSPAELELLVRLVTDEICRDPTPLAIGVHRALRTAEIDLAISQHPSRLHK